ncbi:uncharacterized protein LOC111615450 [Centruroides sculpturatus]|uniref:uncharacterized protein LOC111615450 n=1 Tax=Centruroides sculpturatus TaxID=218467 RepID=UPI000C6EFC74|nr:uncharacterized protein LOC111615450 [Centruroides sculpturatus]XP_023212629.1 uncharacterized protein LOC111615450 [Centruroides sculpturatus]XP_023212630.1 uncharacterized protein LOC111615450 [Centruroides sculpturatus]
MKKILNLVKRNKCCVDKTESATSNMQEAKKITEHHPEAESNDNNSRTKMEKNTKDDKNNRKSMKIFKNTRESSSKKNQDEPKLEYKEIINQIIDEDMHSSTSSITIIDPERSKEKLVDGGIESESATIQEKHHIPFLPHRPPTPKRNKQLQVKAVKDRSTSITGFSVEDEHLSSKNRIYSHEITREVYKCKRI